MIYQMLNFFSMSFSLKALEYDQVERLVGLLNKQLPLHGSGNFPALEVRSDEVCIQIHVN